jgi:hypothetical protein
MALFSCMECGKQISDKAGTCPNCGAPIASAATVEKQHIALAIAHSPKKKTNPVTWLVLALIVIAAVWYIPKMQREASLPLMPIEAKFRPALTGPGLVLMVKNTSDRHLTFMVTLANATVKQEKNFRLDVAPSGTVEVGYKEGWTLSSGDNFKVENSNYQTWTGNIP